MDHWQPKMYCDQRSLNLRTHNKLPVALSYMTVWSNRSFISNTTPPSGRTIKCIKYNGQASNGCSDNVSLAFKSAVPTVIQCRSLSVDCALRYSFNSDAFATLSNNELRTTSATTFKPQSSENTSLSTNASRTLFREQNDSILFKTYIRLNSNFQTFKCPPPTTPLQHALPNAHASTDTA